MREVKPAQLLLLSPYYAYVYETLLPSVLLSVRLSVRRPLSLTTSAALRMFQLKYDSHGTDDDTVADIMLLCKLF